MTILVHPASTQLPAAEWNPSPVGNTCACSSVTTLGQMAAFYADADAVARMDPESLLYKVQWWEPVAPGVEGGLFCGGTILESGRVGDEYFMTKGHFHAVRNRGEYYATVAGEGMLLLMDEQRRTRVEVMTPGSLHYIPGATAHRVVNTGDVPLRFWACWPSDAGHDYGTIATEGFSARVLLRNGVPTLVPKDEQ